MHESKWAKNLRVPENLWFALILSFSFSSFFEEMCKRAFGENLRFCLFCEKCGIFEKYFPGVIFVGVWLKLFFFFAKMFSWNLKMNRKCTPINNFYFSFSFSFFIFFFFVWSLATTTVGELEPQWPRPSPMADH